MSDCSGPLFRRNGTMFAPPSVAGPECGGQRRTDRPAMGEVGNHDGVGSRPNVSGAQIEVNPTSPMEVVEGTGQLESHVEHVERVKAGTQTGDQRTQRWAIEVFENRIWHLGVEIDLVGRRQAGMAESLDDLEFPLNLFEGVVGHGG